MAEPTFSSSIATDSADVAMILAAMELTKVYSSSDPQKRADQFTLIYKAVYAAYASRGSLKG